MDEEQQQQSMVVDWAAFARARAELGAGFVRILGYFREDGDKAVADIEAAMQRRDATALVLPAHKLKGESRQFGADPLADLAEEIELAGRRAIESHVFPDDLVPTVARLRPLYEETIGLFEREANPLVQRRPGGFGNAPARNQSFGRI